MGLPGPAVYLRVPGGGQGPGNPTLQLTEQQGFRRRCSVRMTSKQHLRVGQDGASFRRRFAAPNHTEHTIHPVLLPRSTMASVLAAVGVAGAQGAPDRTGAVRRGGPGSPPPADRNQRRNREAEQVPTTQAQSSPAPAGHFKALVARASAGHTTNHTLYPKPAPTTVVKEKGMKLAFMCSLEEADNGDGVVFFFFTLLIHTCLAS